MKFCKDCKWFRPDLDFDKKESQIAFGKCTNPLGIYLRARKSVDLVSGDIKEIEAQYYHARACREMGQFCGPLARHWEPKEETEVAPAAVGGTGANFARQVTETREDIRACEKAEEWAKWFIFIMACGLAIASWLLWK